MKYFRDFDKQSDAIGVKANVPTVAIIDGMNRVCFGVGDISKDNIFIEDGDFIKLDEATKETRVVVTYNVSSTTETTQLLSSSVSASNVIASMEIDGKEVDVVNEYIFTSTGEHIVKYIFKDSTQIAEFAFSACRSVVSVFIPDSVTTINSSAFATCSLTSVTIGSGITTISQLAFMNTPITSITFGGTVDQWKAINRGMMWHMNVTATTVTCSDGECELDATA